MSHNVNDLNTQKKIKQKLLNKMAGGKGVSNWLNAYPLNEYGSELNTQVLR